MCDGPSRWVDTNIIPDKFTANVITLGGQIPALTMVVYALTQFGGHLDQTVYPPSWVFYAMAFATQWFS